MKNCPALNNLLWTCEEWITVFHNEVVGKWSNDWNRSNFPLDIFMQINQRRYLRQSNVNIVLPISLKAFFTEYFPPVRLHRLRICQRWEWVGRRRFWPGCEHWATTTLQVSKDPKHTVCTVVEYCNKVTYCGSQFSEAVFIICTMPYFHADLLFTSDQPTLGCNMLPFKEYSIL